MDAGFEPTFPFGFGMSYGEFHYHKIWLSSDVAHMDKHIEVHAELSNKGRFGGIEIVQLYIRDLVGSVTRPIKELKGFKRVHLLPGEAKTVSFKLHTDDLAFFGRDMTYKAEKGQFEVWVGGDSNAHLKTSFRID
jgi:beta-glucosidase